MLQIDVKDDLGHIKLHIPINVLARVEKSYNSVVFLVRRYRNLTRYMLRYEIDLQLVTEDSVRKQRQKIYILTLLRTIHLIKSSYFVVYGYKR